MQIVDGVLAHERAYLTILKKRLATLSVISENNPALDPIYGIFKQAFDAAKDTMMRLEQDLSTIVHAPPHPDQPPILVQRHHYVQQLGAMMLCNEPLPSDVFRSIVRDRRREMFALFQHLLEMPEITDHMLRDHVEKIGKLLCSFELPDPVAEKETNWGERIIFATAGAIVGWQGNNAWNRRGWFALSNAKQIEGE